MFVRDSCGFISTNSSSLFGKLCNHRVKQNVDLGPLYNPE
ncbi:hypothetical protein GBAR_LOCUS25784 [Geodia barretti]|uniref:Uncharacterized protein n=1 Tax=Geodia barretti TaxID=519541 RepID=A0AA35XBR9_GEOBA|nr:hypothetical protein GBAR_LOCUS25784 [Geodia barretti]